MRRKLNGAYLFLFCLLCIFSIYVYFTYGDSSNKVNVVDEPLNGVRVTFLDVGQADSILIQTENNNVLIDAGNGNDGKLIVDYLKGLGIKSFSYVIGTHAHEDHIGGMSDIVNNFNIGRFYMPNVITTTKTFEDLLDSLVNKEVQFETPKIGDSFELDSAYFEILFVGEDSDDLNNSSIVIKMIYRDISFLFMGDATTKVEKELLSKNISADILKVGHHGSKTSSGLDFIKKVNPSYAVISVGNNNKYNLPSDKIIDRLNSNNINILRTDQDKTIVINTDGRNININKVNTNTDGG